MDFQKKDEIVSIKGVVRGMDLDKRTLALRDVQNYDKKEINCKLSDDIGNDLKEYLDATVSIKGVKKESYINVKYIENVEQLIKKSNRFQPITLFYLYRLIVITEKYEYILFKLIKEEFHGI